MASGRQTHAHRATNDFKWKKKNVYRNFKHTKIRNNSSAVLYCFFAYRNILFAFCFCFPDCKSKILIDTNEVMLCLCFCVLVGYRISNRLIVLPHNFYLLCVSYISLLVVVCCPFGKCLMKHFNDTLFLKSIIHMIYNSNTFRDGE